MNKHCHLTFFERYGWVEPLIRKSIEFFPHFKKILKKKRHNNRKNSEETINSDAFWQEYTKKAESYISHGDLVLVHSSMDAFEKNGIGAERCLNFFKNLIQKKSCTVVMACFPVLNVRKNKKDLHI